MKDKIYELTVNGEEFREVKFTVTGDRLYSLLDELLRTSNANKYTYSIKEMAQMYEIKIPEEFTDVLD